MSGKNAEKRVKLSEGISRFLPESSFMINYVIDHTPAKRMGRLFEYVSLLNARVEMLEDKVELEDEDFEYLVEDSIIEASKSKSKQRREWLASITVPGVAPVSEDEWEYRIKCIEILANLSDEEVYCLLNHSSSISTTRLDKTRGWHISITIKDRATLSEHELFTRYLLNERFSRYQNSLLRFGLIEKDELYGSGYLLTQAGALFIYAISGELPDR